MLVLKQGQLRGLLRIEGQWSADGDKAVCLGAISAAGVQNSAKPQPVWRSWKLLGFFGQLLIGLVTAANDGITASPLIQILDEGSGKEAAIGQEPNAGTGNRRRCFVQAATDKVAGSRVGTGVTGAQRPVPELLST